LGQRLARGRAFDQLARNPPLREDALQSLLAGGADVESALLPRRGGIVTRGETSLVVGESLLEARDELSCCPGGNMRGARKQAEPSRLGRRVERFDERGRRACRGERRREGLRRGAKRQDIRDRIQSLRARPELPPSLLAE